MVECLLDAFGGFFVALKFHRPDVLRLQRVVERSTYPCCSGVLTVMNSCLTTSVFTESMYKSDVNCEPLSEPSISCVVSLTEDTKCMNLLNSEVWHVFREMY